MLLFALYQMLFLYSQDLSNSKTEDLKDLQERMFLYSQDLSNSKTKEATEAEAKEVFVLSRFK